MPYNETTKDARGFLYGYGVPKESCMKFHKEFNDFFVVQGTKYYKEYENESKELETTTG